MGFDRWSPEHPETGIGWDILSPGFDPDPATRETGDRETLVRGVSGRIRPVAITANTTDESVTTT
jgi:hypothetical protein